MLALGESALNLLGSLSEIPIGIQKLSSFDRLNLFGVIHMIETAIINIDRIQLLWDLVSAHLECLANCNFPQLRALAVDGITCIVINAFLAQGSTPIKTAESKDKRWQNDAWQGTLLNSLLNCLKSGHLETAYTMIHNLPSIVAVMNVVIIELLRDSVAIRLECDV